MITVHHAMTPPSFKIIHVKQNVTMAPMVTLTITHVKIARRNVVSVLDQNTQTAQNVRQRVDTTFILFRIMDAFKFVLMVILKILALENASNVQIIAPPVEIQLVIASNLLNIISY